MEGDKPPSLESVTPPADSITPELRSRQSSSSAKRKSDSSSLYPGQGGFNPCCCARRCCWGQCTLRGGCFVVGGYHLVLAFVLIITMMDVYFINERVDVAQFVLPVGIQIAQGIMIIVAAYLLQKLLCFLYIVISIVHMVVTLTVLILYTISNNSKSRGISNHQVGKAKEAVIICVLFVIFVGVDVYCLVCGIGLYLQIRTKEYERPKPPDKVPAKISICGIRECSSRGTQYEPTGHLQHEHSPDPIDPP